MVATPIGNLGDMTIRGLATLAAADAILCEDTRITAKLLERYGIRNQTSALSRAQCGESAARHCRAS